MPGRTGVYRLVPEGILGTHVHGGCPARSGLDHASHVPSLTSIPFTCLPSPWGWLSQPRTTTEAASPWGSLPFGAPTFRACMTFRTVVGSLFVTLRLATTNPALWSVWSSTACQ